MYLQKEYKRGIQGSSGKSKKRKKGIVGIELQPYEVFVQVIFNITQYPVVLLAMNTTKYCMV